MMRRLMLWVLGWLPRFVTSWLFRRGHIRTLSAALAASRPGDTIEVPQGNYRENLTLKAGVDIVGAADRSSIGCGATLPDDYDPTWGDEGP